MCFFFVPEVKCLGDRIRVFIVQGCFSWVAVSPLCLLKCNNSRIFFTFHLWITTFLHFLWIWETLSMNIRIFSMNLREMFLFFMLIFAPEILIRTQHQRNQGTVLWSVDFNYIDKCFVPQAWLWRPWRRTWIERIALVISNVIEIRALSAK